MIELQIEKMGDRERGLPLVNLLSELPQWPGLDQAKARNLELSQGHHMVSGTPKFGQLSTSQAYRKKPELEVEQLDMILHLYGMLMLYAVA